LQEQIKKMLLTSIAASEIIVNSTDNVHFQVTIISNDFIEKKPIERQRLVYTALGDNISNGTIHALSLKTHTEQEWLKLCAN